ncbi:hypothetical protein [Streptomyces sp. NPDC060184]|uniref:hypothetical protein n=1 Tax=Streptomyces sp. NPDC060184 TaxID=3347064 RepID=UPI003657C148
MLWHAISPVLSTGRRSGGLIGSRRMNSDAKIIILYLESLPSAQQPRALGPLWEFARDAGIRPGPYQKAKKFLKREGYLHEWPYPRSGGRWATAQILSNAPTTRQQAEEYWESCRDYAGLDDDEVDEMSAHPVDVAFPQVAPSDHFPATGLPGARSTGGSPPHVHTPGSSYPLPSRRVRASKTERMAYGRKFDKVSQFAAEDGEGFWTEPPEWLNDQESREGERGESPVAGSASAPVSLPVPDSEPDSVPVSVPVRDSVPDSVPVPVPVEEPVPVPVPVRVARPEPASKPVEEWGAEEVEAERVLLSLGRASSQLRLGAQEARQLVDLAAEWMRRGVSAAELKRALVSLLPEGGVYWPPGFVRKRLESRMPAPPERRSVGMGAVAVDASRPQGVGPQGVEEEPAYVSPLPLVTCKGPGDEHVFRAGAGEVLCGPCRAAEAWAAWAAHREAAARARGEDGPAGDGKGGWRDVLAGAAAPPGTEHDPAEEAAAYAALER